MSKGPTPPYRSGPSRDWIKVKNPDSARALREIEGMTGRRFPPAVAYRRNGRVFRRPGRNGTECGVVLFRG
jgi:hypothetical protein